VISWFHAFAFKCNLYRYTTEVDDPWLTDDNWIGVMTADGGEFNGESVAEQYVVALYWAIMTMTTIGYGDVPVVSTMERLFVTVGLYRLNAVDIELESAWFQPLNVRSDVLISNIADFKFNVYRYITVGMIVGVCVFTYLIGAVTGIMEQVNAAQQRFYNRMDMVNTFVFDYNVDKTLRVKIREYFRWGYTSEIECAHSLKAPGSESAWVFP
jgi:hypothetical protein